MQCAMCCGGGAGCRQCRRRRGWGRWWRRPSTHRCPPRNSCVSSTPRPPGPARCAVLCAGPPGLPTQQGQVEDRCTLSLPCKQACISGAPDAKGNLARSQKILVMDAEFLLSCAAESCENASHLTMRAGKVATVHGSRCLYLLRRALRK